MSNGWNRFIYRLWAPIYDQTVERIFQGGRKRALQLLDLKGGERVLLVGVGTGTDLPLLPEGVEAVGIDLSPEMLGRAGRKIPRLGCKVTLLQGDAQGLLVAAGSCDAVIFNLILSVIPDGALCLKENLGALKPGGRAVVFDKFVPEGVGISWKRRVLNSFSTLFGTEITRSFGAMLPGSGMRVAAQEASLFGGQYQIYLLEQERT